MSTRRHPRGDEPTSAQGLPLLYNIVYCSRAAVDVDAAEVDRLIETAQRNNPAWAITGLLVFGSGIFFQWLEGPRDSVLELMGRIEKDRRHQAIVMLNTGEEIRERLFENWDMELVDADDVRTVLVDALDTVKDPVNARALRDMLEHLETGQLSSLGRE
jgi:hypothetical protein